MAEDISVTKREKSWTDKQQKSTKWAVGFLFLHSIWQLLEPVNLKSCISFAGNMFFLVRFSYVLLPVLPYSFFLKLPLESCWIPRHLLLFLPLFPKFLTFLLYSVAAFLDSVFKNTNNVFCFIQFIIYPIHWFFYNVCDLLFDFQKLLPVLCMKALDLLWEH